MANRLLRLLRSLHGRDHREREMQEEMAAHLDEAVDRLRARGMSEEDARRAALREFGNVPCLQEEARDAWPFRGADSIRADLRFAFRTFRKTPFSSVAIVLILALGLGANTALFSYVHSRLTLPAPGISRDDSLVRIRTGERRSFGMIVNALVARPISYSEFREYRARTDLFAGVAAWSRTDVRVETSGGSRTITFPAQAKYVTDGYFPLLGVQLTLGPGLPDLEREADSPIPSPEPVAVVSHGLWDLQFGRSPGVIGERIRVNGIPTTIVGVAPPRFAGVNPGSEAMMIWLPISARPVTEGSSAPPSASFDPALFEGTVARLQPGVTHEAATEGAAYISDAATGSMSSSPADSDRTYEFSIAPLLAENAVNDSVERITRSALPLLTLTLLIHVLVCTNVASLLAAGAHRRKREIAVRLALGAHRRRVVRQLVIESVIRAVAAAVIGVLILWLLIEFFGDRISQDIRLFNPAIVIFLSATAFGTGILLGLLPALHATRVSISDSLKASSSSMTNAGSRLPRSLVVAQTALSQPLLAGIAVLIVSTAGGWSTFKPSPADDRVLEIDPRSRFWEIPVEEHPAAIVRVTESILEVPGVHGLVVLGPSGQVSPFTAHPEDQEGGDDPENLLWLEWKRVGPQYFEVMNLPMVLGGGVPAIGGNEDNAYGIVIGSRTARALMGAASPVGKRLVAQGDGQTYTISGVVDESESAYQGFDVDRSGFIYLVGDFPAVFPRILVSTDQSAQALGDPIREILREAAGGLEPGVRTLAEVRASDRTRIVGLIGSGLGGGLLALFLAALGLYAVVSTAVETRKREIGIRAALGSTAHQSIRVIATEGMYLGGLGIILGLPLSMVLIRVFAAQEIQWLSGGTVFTAGLATCLVVLGTTLVASWIPARQAASVDPMTVLRSE